MTFSAASRSGAWTAARSQTYDLLVIGLGVTGAGIAYEAAARGLKVLAVDAGDIGGGTSSRSSRLIHGGLRYLEMFDFGLVFEALGERGRLLAAAPHLVRPLEFLYPVYAGGSVGMLKLTAGMWLYDGLSLGRGVKRHRMVGRSGALSREPHLRREGLRGGALYHDAQVDDARLTLEVARLAAAAGAVVLPRAGVSTITSGELDRVGLEDTRTGERSQATARLVVCAAGPWLDEVRRIADPSVAPRLRPTKGVHIQLRGDRVGNRRALIFESPVDGRVMFVLPWRSFTYVGTTDTDYSGSPGEARAGEADVRYLLDSLNGLFPGAGAGPEDVLSTWAGVRPLIAPDRDRPGVSASGTSREHEIWRDPSGLLCVGGGKLTTFRVMAEDAVEEALEILEREHGVRGSGERVPLPSFPASPGPDAAGFREAFIRRAAAFGLTAHTAQHLATRHGADADRILRLIGEDPSLAAPISPDHPYLRAEIDFAVRHEMALTLEDVLRRRLHLFYDAPDGGLSVVEHVARQMAALVGVDWSEEEIRAEIERYAEAVRSTRPRSGTW